MKVNDVNWDAVINNKPLAVVVFGAAHCPQCKPLRDALDRDNIEHFYADITSASLKCSEYNILSVPTTVVLRNGVPRGAVVGPDIKKIKELL